MQDEKKTVDRNMELENVLSELNSKRKKASMPEAQKSEAVASNLPSDGALTAEQTPRKRSITSSRRNADKGRRGGANREETRKPKPAFRATIFASEPEDEEDLTKNVGKHIAVKSAEVVKTEDAPERMGEFASPVSRRKRPRRSRREKLTALIGLIISVFCIIGIVSTVIGGWNLTYDLLNSTAKKEELEKFIFPLVIVDSPEFEDPKLLDNSVIVSSAIWSFIIDDNDKTKYVTDDFGEMTVPDVDIEPYIRKLYGSDVPIQHQTIDGGSVRMFYDAENKCYLIESTPSFLPYTPRVDKINQSKGVYTLRVSYVLPDALWELDSEHTNARVDKELEYRLKKTDTGYQILSVKLLALSGMEISPSSEVLPDNDLVELESKVSEPTSDGELLPEVSSDTLGDSSDAVSSDAATE